MTTDAATSAARDQAGEVARTGRDDAADVGSAAGRGATDVAGTAREQTRRVAGEASDQVRHVMDDVRAQLADEAGQQSTRLAANLRRLSGELANMADSGDPDTPLPGVMHELATRGGRAADFLDTRGPDGLVDEVRTFARRRPGAFLLSAAAAGFAVGRLGRGAQAARSDGAPDDGQRGAADGTAAEGGALGAHQPAIPHDTVMQGHGATTGEPYPVDDQGAVPSRTTGGAAPAGGTGTGGGR